jgi:hypothetical protein
MARPVISQEEIDTRLRHINALMDKLKHLRPVSEIWDDNVASFDIETYSSDMVYPIAYCKKY